MPNKELHVGAPNPKQRQFLLATNRFVCYGGARGGGKSWVVRRKAELLALRWPGIRLLFLRRTLKELRENHMGELSRDLAGIAKYREVDAKYTFANGSTLKLGYCDSERDVDQYQGQEYDCIFLDEATQFTEYQFLVLSAALRGANDLPKRMYLTCNPGGVGHAWVKRLFIDRDYRPGEEPADYLFIPALVTDNRVLMERDPGYVKMLERLPPDLRRAWREGDWSVFVGQYFPEFAQAVHVERAGELPAAWARYAALDYGLDALAGYFAAVEPGGRIHVYREVYATGRLMSEAAALMRQAARGEEIRATFAPPDLWNRRQDTGRSAADVFAMKGVYLTRVSNDRVMGWLEVKEALQVREGGPRLLIDESCRMLIKSMPYLLVDKSDPGDVADEPHEYTHGPDALRYLLAGRPQPAEDEEQREESGRDGVAAFLDYGR